MITFNPDGSIRLPPQFQQKKDEERYKMVKGRCMRVRKDLVSQRPPKSCSLHLTLSDAISDHRFIVTIHTRFKDRVQVPTSLRKISEKEYEITIGTDFRRCSDCSSLIREYHEFLEGNLIEEKGACTFEGKKNTFCYEDYFD